MTHSWYGKDTTLCSMGPETEHSVLNTWLERICPQATTGLKMLKNLTRHTAEQRQHLYTLVQRQDFYEPSLAYTLVAKQEPAPGPQSRIVGSSIRDLEMLRNRQRTWWQDYPQEPWSAELEEIDQDLAAIQGRLRTIAQRVDTAHQQWIAHHVEAFSRNVAMLQEHP